MVVAFDVAGEVERWRCRKLTVGSTARSAFALPQKHSFSWGSLWFYMRHYFMILAILSFKQLLAHDRLGIKVRVGFLREIGRIPEYASHDRWDQSGSSDFALFNSVH